MGNRPSVLQSARVIGLCTLASRVLGMARDVASSYFFGAGMLWDAFSIAYRVPNLFRRLFGEGALTAAFVPAFVVRLEAGKREEAFTLLNRILTGLLVFLGALTALGYVVVAVAWRVWPDEKTRLILELLAVMLPYVPLICGAAILGAALNGLFRFFAPAFAPVVLNVVWLTALPICALTLPPHRAIMGVAAAVLVGGVLQVATMAIPLHREGVRLRLGWDRRDEGVQQVGRQFLPAVFGLALVQINELVDSIIAEVFVPGHGAVSALYYGNQLTQLPLSLIGTSLATAALPGLSAAAGRGDEAEFGALLRRSLSAALFLALPASAGLVLFGGDIIAVLFERGRFGPEATARAGTVLALYGTGLWCYCVNQVQVRAFHARHDTRTPVRVSTAMVFLNLTLNLVLVGPLAEAGLALATSICGLVNLLTLQILLRRGFPGIDFSPLRLEAVKALLCTAGMAAASWALARWALPLWPVLRGTTLAPRAVSLALVIGAAFIVYFGLARALGMRDALTLLRRRRAS